MESISRVQWSAVLLILIVVFAIPNVAAQSNTSSPLDFIRDFIRAILDFFQSLFGQNTGTISGTVYTYKYTSGSKEITGRAAGVLVQVFSGDVIVSPFNPPPVLASTTTDANGCYAFNLKAGTYQIVANNGVYGEIQAFTISAGQNITKDLEVTLYG